MFSSKVLFDFMKWWIDRFTRSDYLTKDRPTMHTETPYLSCHVLPQCNQFSLKYYKSTYIGSSSSESHVMTFDLKREEASPNVQVQYIELANETRIFTLNISSRSFFLSVKIECIVNPAESIFSKFAWSFNKNEISSLKSVELSFSSRILYFFSFYLNFFYLFDSFLSGPMFVNFI